jgi:hypothetical protein
VYLVVRPGTVDQVPETFRVKDPQTALRAFGDDYLDDKVVWLNDMLCSEYDRWSSQNFDNLAK